jgi:hypothetical protein
MALGGQSFWERNLFRPNPVWFGVVRITGSSGYKGIGGSAPGIAKQEQWTWPIAKYA